MVASRQDAWTDDDDLVLAEVTLRHIREGGTQLAAFEEVGQRLGRTAAACGFRWNSAVRKRYDAAIVIAKGQRQQLKKSGRVSASVRTEFATEAPEMVQAPTVATATMAPEEPVGSEAETELDAAIRVLTQQKEVARRYKHMEQQMMEQELLVQRLQEENQRLRKELENVQGVNDDYKALVQIMERARKLAFLKEEEAAKPVFKMDSNGNLERIE